jgi:radical SAM protein with 4Fe4S-binding SPASM domain
VKKNLEATRREIKKRLVEMDSTIPEEGYPYPLNIVLEPTNRCNLKCVMCPSTDQTRERGIMPMEIWQRVVDDVMENSPTTAIWPAMMGEGLVAQEKFLEMLEYACEKGAILVWNTNAVLLEQRWVERIVKLPLREIIVGLDAIDAETYGKIRRGGDFQAAVQNVLSLLVCRNQTTKITVQFIEQELNAGQAEAFREFWLEKGAVVKIRPRLGWGDGVASPALVLEQSDRIGPCPWLMRNIAVHWNGNAVQCDADWDQRFPVGNVTDLTIKEIWEGILLERRQRHQRGDFSFELCQTCNDWQAGISKVYHPSSD